MLQTKIEADLRSADGYDCDVWQLSETSAVLVEDPNGPHPAAYVYERRSRPWWELDQVIMLTRDQALELSCKCAKAPATTKVDVWSRCCKDVRRDLTRYLA